MPEISSANAATLIGVSDETIRRLIDRSVLPARKFGLRGIVRIDIDELRKLAERLNYRFDEEAAKQFYEN